VARAVRLVVRDGVHVPACARRAAGSFCRRGFGGRGARRGGRGGAVYSEGRCSSCRSFLRAVCAFYRRRCGDRGAGRGGGGGAACRVGQCASCTLRGVCSWCTLSAWWWRKLRRSTSWRRWRGWCGLSCGTACKLPLAWGVQLVVLVGVAVAGVVRFDVWDGVHVAACVRRAAGGSCRRGGGAGGAVRRLGRRACCRLRGACILCFLSAWRWRRWCGSTCGTACMLPLAWGVHFVLLVGLAVTGVVRFGVWDGMHVAASVGRAVCASCRRGGGAGGAV